MTLSSTIIDFFAVFAASNRVDLSIRIVGAVILAASLYGGIVSLGVWRWNKATRGLIARLDAAAVSGSAAFYDARKIADLPAPVRRYLERVLTQGQPILLSVDLKLEGLFNLSLDAPKWKPFTSTQHVVTNRPGFVWNARIAMVPGVPIRVHDAYVAGDGVLRPSILGLFSLGEVKGAGEIARGPDRATPQRVCAGTIGHSTT